MNSFPCESLVAWNKSNDLIKKVFQLTMTFPENERTRLVEQLRNDSLALALNIAEGTADNTMIDRTGYSIMAYRNLTDILKHLMQAYDLNYFGDDELRMLRKFISDISNKICSLYKFQISRLSLNNAS